MAIPSKRGIAYQFNGPTFRNAIRFVFEMETSNDPNSAITFHFDDTVSFTGPRDGDDVPFDPRTPVVRTQHTTVRVPCDVEFQKAGDEPTAFGVVVPAKVKVTLLDQDYEKIKGASYVTVGGDRYAYHYEQPDYALFDVGIHEILYTAENER